MGRNNSFPSATMLGDRSAHVVDFDGSSDPLHPHNWPPQKRYATPAHPRSPTRIFRLTHSHFRLSIATPVCLSTLIATLGCALFAPATNEISAHFSLAQQTTLLGTSLYVLGFALGPLVFAPASELIGRRTPLVAGMLGCAILSLAAGAANDAQTLLITRFFAGAFGASPLCVVPAMLADLYSDGARGTAIAIYALAIFAGPFAGPFVGGFIVANPSMGWRWTQSFPAILGAANVVAVLCFVDDTSAPFLLVRKAAILRWETGIWSLHEEQERLELDWRAIGQKYFLRPLRLLALEPIVLSISIFMSFIYCPLYALMKGCPYAFGDIRGMGPGVAGLPLLAILFGQVLALCLIVGLKMCERRDVDLEKAAFGTKNRGVAPENGLLPAVIGAPVSSIGLLR